MNPIFYVRDIVSYINEFIKDDNPLLSCNKYLKGLKLEYITLNKTYSLKYYENAEFRDLIQSKMNNSRFQLSLNLSNCSQVTDLSVLKNIHSLDLSYCRCISDDISALENTYILNLKGCENITNVSMLGNLHTLNLSYCYYITDVSMLGNLHTLDLDHCYFIYDITMLGNLHTLNISYCNYVKDVSMLENVHTLDITGCSKITPTNVFSLQKLHILIRDDKILYMKYSGC